MPYGLRNREVLLANTRQVCRSEKTALSLSYSFFYTNRDHILPKTSSCGEKGYNLSETINGSVKCLLRVQVKAVNLSFIKQSKQNFPAFFVIELQSLMTDCLNQSLKLVAPRCQQQQ